MASMEPWRIRGTRPWSPTGATMLRTLIIDDNLLFLDTLSELLGRFEGVRVVGVASNGQEGLRAASELVPDLVFVDLKMPGVGGFQVAARLRWQQPLTRVVVVSLHDDAEYRARAMEVGAERFVSKNDLFSELPHIIGAAALSPGASSGAS